MVLTIGLQPALHGYFDIFSGVIQTLIFIMLTMIWSQGANGVVNNKKTKENKC